MKLSLNKEYAVRHLGVAVLFLGLAGWFGYDGLVGYPSQTPHDIYVSIEKSEPPADMDLEGFKAQKIKAQYGFAAVFAAIALVVGLRLWKSWKSTLEWDDEKMCGTLTKGRALAFGDVEHVDERRWAKKGILVLVADDGRRVTLDAWHHTGVEDLAKRFLGKG